MSADLNSLEEELEESIVNEEEIADKPTSENIITSEKIEIGLNLVGVQFRRAGRIFDFAAGTVSCLIGDHVIVDSERGPAIGKVARIGFYPPEIAKAQTKNRPLKFILRKASPKEVQGQGKLNPEEIVDFTIDRVKTLKLSMKVLKAETQFGGSKIVIYFSSPGRVDFRELVKELAGGLRTRVELKQVGARDETKLIGGLGICGREYCCSSFLRDFIPVSIRMAKNQNLALNPTKVSGGCGRLLCCLSYENEAYTDLRKHMLPLGTIVLVSDTKEEGRVIKTDLLNQIVMIESKDGQMYSHKVAALEVVKKGQINQEEEAVDELDLEMDEWAEGLDLELLEDEANAQKRPATRKEAPSQGQRERSQNRDRENDERSGEQRQGQRPRGPRQNDRPPREGGGNRDGSNRDRGPREPREPRAQGQQKPREQNQQRRDQNRGPQGRGSQ